MTERTPRSFGGVLAGPLKWGAPALTIALMPKCPACFAACVALWTGLGLSFTAAAHLRTAVLALSIASLVVLSGLLARRLMFR